MYELNVSKWAQMAQSDSLILSFSSMSGWNYFRSQSWGSGVGAWCRVCLSLTEQMALFSFHGSSDADIAQSTLLLFSCTCLTSQRREDLWALECPHASGSSLSSLSGCQPSNTNRTPAQIMDAPAAGLRTSPWSCKTSLWSCEVANWLTTTTREGEKNADDVLMW